jgi:hypothetical protein
VVKEGSGDFERKPALADPSGASEGEQPDVLAKQEVVSGCQL